MRWDRIHMIRKEEETIIMEEISLISRGEKIPGLINIIKNMMMNQDPEVQVIKFLENDNIFIKCRWT